ncbi:VanZ family protein [Desulfitobacterium metallireducens]|uniref:Teicoplanin resistance protein VanZ n=1 Tax=Desulfitobacterium metallireducens DSM 15288 TaxID=871968 RepID=W0EDG4_9FIRM|nr:VanZ family protein [Desulfitobacterium metallireducens]AHF07116.1 teicoplanin resistance protein VanZ [Desulfitobacterium metallireducens DSM 15288]
MNKLIRKITVILFLTYFTYLLYRLFFYAYGQYFRFYENEIRYNLIPFKTIFSYIMGMGKYKLDVWFFNLFGNIFAFMPMGFLLPLIFQSLKSFKRITSITFLISSFLEMIQFWLKLGITDIDDVILNTLGGLVGYLFLILSRKIVDPIMKKIRAKE